MKFNYSPMFLAVVSAVSLSYMGTANAQDDYSQVVLEEVVITGTRAPGRSAEDLPVPVDVISSDVMEQTGQTEVGRMLQRLAPSFNFSSSSISDGTDAIRPATLRGLGPDQTLVLVNGKRRHQASLIHINTSVGRGTSGVDMNAIPAASIKRIEVLRDGAAAQYGSDAIAGVINIVLKDENEGGRAFASYGEYSEGDGETYNLDLNGGFSLGDNGFLNATVNYRERSRSNRAGMQGNCVYGGCEDTDGNGIVEPGDPRELDFNRNSFRIGDASSEQYGLMINTAYNIGSGELYGFLTYSDRDSQSGAFYRDPASGASSALDDGDNVIPMGFLPKINSEIEDLSVNVGYRMDFDSGMGMDISYTTGQNEINYVTSNTINYSYVNYLNYGEGLSDEEIRSTIPRSGDAYGLELGLSTFNLDFNQLIGDLALAFGFEYRQDEYKIKPGEPYSYMDFDSNMGAPIFPQDAGAGTQGFGGIAPISEVDEDRDVYSVYLDTEYEFTDSLLVSAAARYDDYEDFGDTVNFKLAANWALTEEFRLRGSVSTGFRAPGMQQQYFNNISTQFVTNPADPGGPQIAAQVGTFRNDSELAQEIGIPQLKEEESTNYAIGMVWTPGGQLSITVDYYSIEIDDRIVISNKLTAEDDPSGALGDALMQVGANSGQFFLNGADTETEGIDLVVTYPGTELFGGTVDLTLAANWTETEVVDIFTSGGISNLDPEDVFSSQDISIIEEWQPEDRINFTAFYQRDRFQLNLSLNRFGEYTVEDGGRQTYDPVVVTDLSAKYTLDSGLGFILGANNIFDEYPDKNEIGNSRGGSIEETPGGDLLVSSPGVFTYSRRSAPFGFNGAYWYAGVSYDF